MEKTTASSTKSGESDSNDSKKEVNSRSDSENERKKSVRREKKRRRRTESPSKTELTGSKVFVETKDSTREEEKQRMNNSTVDKSIKSSQNQTLSERTRNETLKKEKMSNFTEAASRKTMHGKPPKGCCKKIKHRFKNQTLAGWRPVYRKTWIMPIMFFFAGVFLVLSVVLLVLADTVKEYVIDYTDCSMMHRLNSTNNTSYSGAIMANGSNTSSYRTPKICKEEIIKKSFDNWDPNTICRCKVEIKVDVDLEAPVELYYGLKNFWQNHRRLVFSRNNDQLRGLDLDVVQTDSCFPYDEAYDPIAKKDLPIVPCGALANCMFNDTITLSYEDTVDVPLKDTGICDPDEKGYMFSNPPGASSLKDKFNGTTKPPYWSKYIYELDPNNTNNNGLVNEDLIVWMKVSNTKNFRKKYRLVDHSSSQTDFKSGLPAGTYYALIEYKYPVSYFGGQKLLVLKSASSSILANYNTFVGTIFLITGLAVLTACLVIILIGKKFSKTKRIMRKDPNPAELQAKQFNTIKNLMTNVKKN